jgi:hypothetical protein
MMQNSGTNMKEHTKLKNIIINIWKQTGEIMLTSNNLLTTDTDNCRKIVFSVISMTIIVFMIYSNSFDCSWHFDDSHTITENPRIHMKNLSWEAINDAMRSHQSSAEKLYRPVSCLSFAFNYFFWELDVFGYHLVNILFI